MAKRGLYSLALIALIGFLAASEPLPLWGDLDAPARITQCGRLDSLLVQQQLNPEYLLVLGSDGTGFQIEASAAQYIWLLQDSTGWFSSAPTLPPVCSIRSIAAIAVAAPPARYAFDYINEHGVSSTVSPYTAILQECDVLGFSERNGVAVMKYKKRRVYRLNTLSQTLQCTTNRGTRPWERSELQHVFLREPFYFSLNTDTLFTIQEIPRTQ